MGELFRGIFREIYSAALWVDSHNGFVIVVLTFLMVSFNIILLWENRKLRKLGSEPHIVAYVRPGKHINILNLYISNIGLGPAFNVKFYIPDADAIIEKYRVRLPGKNSIREIQTLPQGGEIKAYFGNFFEFEKENPLEKILLTIHYDDVFGRKRESKSNIDVSSLSGYTRVGHPDSEEISKSLKEISKTLKNFKIKNDILLIETSSREKLADELNEDYKEIRDFIDKRP
ncbi:hypothetical protein [Paremcibacter congregatus]|uniref:Uncharacterized protein n=1 Tax=Paremcibacter congregatus TaxID=2043170 RepID=A0A2G4YUU9_9PROT|nr:hypothetical protein [Paremcibacter congregatus]PHZ86105.1 hypothetical protein CRD36_05395 [Paremcibacter congregatus]QDE27071.1 hypothetical protein FIV45_07170 [Paremcibacter congregatus]